MKLSEAEKQAHIMTALRCMNCDEVSFVQMVTLSVGTGYNYFYCQKCHTYNTVKLHVDISIMKPEPDKTK